MLLSFYLTSGGCCVIIETSKERKGTIMKKHLIWTNYELEEDRKGYPEMEEDEQEKLYSIVVAINDHLACLLFCRINNNGTS